MGKVTLEDAREICADGTFFPNNLSIIQNTNKILSYIAPTCFGIIYTIFMELYTEILYKMKKNIR